MKIKKVRRNYCVSLEIDAKIRKISEETGLSFSKIIERAIKNYGGM